MITFTGKDRIVLLSCNVRGLANFKRRSAIISHLMHPKGSASVPHILAFQETSSNLRDEASWASQFKSKILYAHCSEGGREGGFLLAVRDSLDVQIHSHVADPKGHYQVASIELQMRSLL